MNYALSDIHNHFEEYLKLRAILGKGDHGFIVGDGIDRGATGCGIDLILSVMDDPNMTYLLGNHEQLMINALGSDGSINAGSDRILQNWLWNGGGPTLERYNKKSMVEKKRIIEFLRSCSDEINLELEDGRKYYITHAWQSNARGKLWGRPQNGIHSVWAGNSHLIFGHTVSLNLYPDPQAQLDAIQVNNDHIHIVHSQNNWSCIDCGAGYNFTGAALGMLRLEDMSEFYAKIDSV